MPWEPAEVYGPDVQDRETLLLLAKMANNAYTEPDKSDWYDIGPYWNVVSAIVLFVSPSSREMQWIFKVHDRAEAQTYLRCCTWSPGCASRDSRSLLSIAPTLCPFAWRNHTTFCWAGVSTVVYTSRAMCMALLNLHTRCGLKSPSSCH